MQGLYIHVRRNVQDRIEWIEEHMARNSITNSPNCTYNVKYNLKLEVSIIVCRKRHT